MIVRRLFVATSAVVTVAGIVTACSSVPDVTFSDDAGGIVTPDGKAPDAPAPFDGGGDVVTTDAPKDAPPDVPICTQSNGGVEDCEDGLDNDCNGKVDCADTACTAFECIATPPVGWTLTAESDDTRPTCPTGYATPRDVEVVQGTGAGTCSCSCGLANAGEACNLGQSSVVISATATTCSPAANGAQTPQSVNAAEGACTALTTNIDLPNPNAYGIVTGPPDPPSGCSATVTPNSVPPITAGRTCTPATAPSLGGGCGVGQVCVRKSAPGLALCVQKAGSNACPTTYGTRKSAGGATLADGGAVDGGATVDNRACNTCTCSSPMCNTPTVTLFDQADCTTGGNKNTSGAIGTNCAATTNKNFTATHYKSTVTMVGCQPAFNTATTGTVSFTDPTTICCP